MYISCSMISRVMCHHKHCFLSFSPQFGSLWLSTLQRTSVAFDLNSADQIMQSVSCSIADCLVICTYPARLCPLRKLLHRSLISLCSLRLLIGPSSTLLAFQEVPTADCGSHKRADQLAEGVQHLGRLPCGSVSWQARGKGSNAAGSARRAV